jgi:hypothetical protein
MAVSTGVGRVEFPGDAIQSAAAVAAVASGTTHPSRHRVHMDSVVGAAGSVRTKTAIMA